MLVLGLVENVYYLVQNHKQHSEHGTTYKYYIASQLSWFYQPDPKTVPIYDANQIEVEKIVKERESIPMDR